MTSRSLSCPPLSQWHAAWHNRGVSFSISGQSSSSGIHQVLPTSFIRSSPSFLTPHFLPERNLPWHVWLLKSLSLSFPIILSQLWWGLILLYRRQSVKFSLFYMSFAVCGTIYLRARDSNFHSPPLSLFIDAQGKKIPWSRRWGFINISVALHWLQYIKPPW